MSKKTYGSKTTQVNMAILRIGPLVDELASEQVS
jgi:hypothetical protein